MNKVSLHDINRIFVSGLDKPFYGCSQKWYRKWWQRLSGCGPSVVATIMAYLYRKDHESPENTPLTKSDFLDLMEEVWTYVTPTYQGIPTTAIFCGGLRGYLKAKGLSINLTVIDVSEKMQERTNFDEILLLIRNALSCDAPVAFLSLDKGNEKNLDSWHWSTVISLEYDENTQTALIEVVDNGSVLKADLFNWYQTTRRGGGFVSFCDK